MQFAWGIEPSPTPASLQKFSAATPGPPPTPWRVVGLPDPKIPRTEFRLIRLEGQTALQIKANQSYASLSHAWPAQVPSATATLSWRWRLDQALVGADLRRKEGDDAALKVCAMFDLPLERLGFFERNLMRLARSRSGEMLPSATLCYVWDPSLPAGTQLTNAFTRRVRYWVLDGATTPLRQWSAHSRNLRQDFLRAFGTETDTVPPLIGIAVGADADNTGSSSLGYLSDLSLDDFNTNGPTDPATQ